jgi:DNA-binding IclR family transcriptional regulator
MGLADISARLGIPKSTTHAILRSLIAEGLIEKIDGDSYALGTGILALSQSVRVNVEIRDRAAPHVRALADRAGESVYLTFLEGDRILYIYAVESSRRLIARTAVGDRMLMHCTGVGKAILAHLPSEQAIGILERVGMPAITPKTVTDVATLAQELQAIRQRGYSFDDGENEVGLYCIGAPIFGSAGSVIGGCSISGTDPQIIGSRAPELSSLLMSACLDMSRNLGYVPPSLSQLHSAMR